MALYKADGTELFDADITAAGGSAVVTNTYKLNIEILEDRKITSGTQSTSRRIRHHKNEIITQKELDALIADATDTAPAG